MKNRSFALVAIVAVAALLAAPAWNFQQDRKAIQAYVLKVVNDVEKKAPTTGWATAVTLDQLKSGHEVRTGDKSFALIRFADESKIAVRSKSIITISGEVEGKQILNRNVHIDRGRVVFGVKKQETEQFRFSSPISVASIRGTEGGTGFEPANNSADLTLTSGVGDFTSTQTNCSVTVTAGQKGTIDSTGNCNRVQATPEELNNNNPNSSVNQTGEQAPQPPPAKRDTTASTGGQPTRRDTTAAPPPPPPPPARAEFGIERPASGLTSGVAQTLRFGLKNAPAQMTQGTLFYRVQGAPSYKQVSLTISSSNVSGTIPESDVRAGANRVFEYYLSLRAADGTTYTFPKESPEMNPYTLSITPRIIRLRIPVADPNGAQKYLTISYEE